MTKEDDTKKENTPFPIISGKELFEKDLPPIEWLIPNIIPRRGFVLFGGRGSTYKTWLALVFAICSASGNEFLQEFTLEKKKVIYIDEENNEILLKERLLLIAKGLKIQADDLKDLHFSIFNEIKLDTSGGYIALHNIIKKTSPDIIIVDSMVRVMEGVEDKAEDVRKVFANLKKIFKEFRDICFIILHHTNKGNSKNGMERLRGSSDFGNSADLVLMFEPYKFRPRVTVDIAKNRLSDATKFREFCFDIDSNSERILFKYSSSEEKEELLNKCVKDILKYIVENNLLFLNTGSNSELFIHLKKLDYKLSIIYSTLHRMCEMQILKKLLRGTYEVLKTSSENQNSLIL